MPDRIEFGEGSIWVFWDEPKVVLNVSVDDPPHWATNAEECDAQPP